jgi:uncharacterized protein YneF (UPF0154 family)
LFISFFCCIFISSRIFRHDLLNGPVLNEQPEYTDRPD